MKKRFSDEQIVAILREAETDASITYSPGSLFATHATGVNNLY